MSLAENQKRTAQAFVDGYNEWTIEALMRPRSDDCVHARLPASLNRPERNNEAYTTFFQPLSKTVKEMKMITQKIVNDTEQHMAVLHARGYGETPVGPYRNEYAFFFYFNEEGTKVVRVEEFVDSEFSNGFFARMQEYMKAQKGE
ncbi:Uu.00g101180.m01.CDS01 [Anthostomella pinea]|uniref:Uu.00g101180.m01.CDS01 n=1 Tax=Anthostomella pinea TaxID=933095 RepID=A0AAI8VD77_9PEZI|nr:Uu.00g101180.m01.CDS01 [Anthostomella pinea]